MVKTAALQTCSEHDHFCQPKFSKVNYWQEKLGMLPAVKHKLPVNRKKSEDAQQSDVKLYFRAVILKSGSRDPL